MRPNTYPSISDITMVVPTKITDLAVYVKLIEYNDLEGLIILSDLSKSRFRTINSVVSIGKKFPACVLSVNTTKQQITLSKKVVSVEESKLCDDDYKALKYVNELVNFYAKKIKKDHNIVLNIDTIYKIFIWPVSKDPQPLLLALRIASKDFDSIYKNKLSETDPVLVQCMKDVLRLKFKDKEVFLEAILDIRCYGSDGIRVIKTSLLKACDMATKDIPFEVKMVKSPYYSFTVKSIDPESAANLINKAIDFIQNELVSNGALVQIIKRPKIVLEKEFVPDDYEDAGEEDENQLRDDDK